jgi:hypothetical protein
MVPRFLSRQKATFLFHGVGVARGATNVFEPQNIFGIEKG